MGRGRRLEHLPQAHQGAFFQLPDPVLGYPQLPPDRLEGGGGVAHVALADDGGLTRRQHGESLVDQAGPQAADAALFHDFFRIGLIGGQVVDQRFGILPVAIAQRRIKRLVEARDPLGQTGNLGLGQFEPCRQHRQRIVVEGGGTRPLFRRDFLEREEQRLVRGGLADPHQRP